MWIISVLLSFFSDWSIDQRREWRGAGFRGRRRLQRLQRSQPRRIGRQSPSLWPWWVSLSCFWFGSLDIQIESTPLNFYFSSSSYSSSSPSSSSSSFFFLFFFISFFLFLFFFFYLLSFSFLTFFLPLLFFRCFGTKLCNDMNSAFFMLVNFLSWKKCCLNESKKVRAMPVLLLGLEST